jgi:hypothetical protein
MCLKWCDLSHKKTLEGVIICQTTHLSQKDANQKRNVKDLGGVLCMYTWLKKYTWIVKLSQVEMFDFTNYCNSNFIMIVVHFQVSTLPIFFPTKLQKVNFSLV